MNRQTFIELLEHPFDMDISQAKEIRGVIEEYPYFQSARVIYLKALKDLESFRYNHELKKTAAYTTDRTILFDFITSKAFIGEKKQIKEKKVEEKIIVPKLEDEDVVQEFEVKTQEQQQAEKLLEMGRPLNFQGNEQHTFSSWLQMVNIQEPIKRESKSEQDDIIEKFIKLSPKISRIDKSKPVEIVVPIEPQTNELMTETLAKIYLEQKKYDNAIKAYEILSLKYPEKSVFFANQIKQIRILQKS